MIDYKKKYLKYKKKYLAIKKLTRGGKGKKPKSSDTNGAWQCEKCGSQYKTYKEAEECERWCTETDGQDYGVPDIDVYAVGSRKAGNMGWSRRGEQEEWKQQQQWADERQRQEEEQQQQQWEWQKQNEQQWEEQQQQWDPPAMTEIDAWRLLYSTPLNDPQFLEAGRWLVTNRYADQAWMEQYMVNRGYQFKNW